MGIEKIPIEIFCSFIAILSIGITFALTYCHVKRGSSYGGISLLNIPLSLMGLFLFLYAIGRGINLLNFSAYYIIICFTWLLLELCIFIYSLITKEDTFLHNNLLILLFLMAMVPLEKSFSYQTLFYICVFSGVIFSVFDLFHCNSTK